MALICQVIVMPVVSSGRHPPMARRPPCLIQPLAFVKFYQRAFVHLDGHRGAEAAAAKNINEK